jgi:hypothetical protein
MPKASPPGRNFFVHAKRFSRALRGAVESLDHGKSYVFEGYSWLKERLFGELAE